MNDLTFLKQRTENLGEVFGCIFAHYRDGTTQKIDGVRLDVLEQACPILAIAFEQGRHGYSHSMENTTAPAVATLLRCAYTSEAVPFDLVDYSQSLLLNLEIYFLAIRYDFLSLQRLAQGRVSFECEISYASDAPPKDLIPSINFMYEHLVDHGEVIDIILNYCISCFYQHKLDQNQEFLNLAYENKQFHHDLCKTNRDRGFKDEAAAAIVRLAVKPTVPTIGEKILGDCLTETWNENEPGTPLPQPHVLPYHHRPQPSPAPTKPLPRLPDQPTPTPISGQHEWQHHDYAELRQLPLRPSLWSRPTGKKAHALRKRQRELHNELRDSVEAALIKLPVPPNIATLARSAGFVIEGGGQEREVVDLEMRTTIKEPKVAEVACPEGEDDDSDGFEIVARVLERQDRGGGDDVDADLDGFVVV